MDDFYSKINDPSLNGAIFIAVCRGKVSHYIHSNIFDLKSTNAPIRAHWVLFRFELFKHS